MPQNGSLGNKMAMNDYFIEVPIYPPHLFRRRYRTRWDLFVHIVQACEASCHFSHSPEECCRSHWFYRVLKYICHNEGDFIHPSCGLQVSLHWWRYYTRMCEAICEGIYVRMFAKTLICVFGDEYLWDLSEEDMKRLMVINEARGCMGLLGSIDCMH
jgi:hypothetical protein